MQEPPLDDPLPKLTEAKVDRTRFDPSRPQRGHGTSEGAGPERTNFSNLSLQVGHWYSKIGMELLRVKC